MLIEPGHHAKKIVYAFHLNKHMKKIIKPRYGLSVCIVMAFASVTYAQPLFELSNNVYRIPYESDKDFKVQQDHITHSPQGRYDLRVQGTDDCNSHRIVSAAAGTVRRVVENNSASCPSCGSNNNYVWIEHANGEWSKYTHFKQNSVTVNVNDVVCAGTILGFECYVGGTSPAQFRHLHFEVRRPNDPSNIIIDPAGGFMDDADHLIPVINSISKHYFDKDDTWTSSGSTTCSFANISIGSQNIANTEIKIYMASSSIASGNSVITHENGSSGLWQAGGSVTFNPGFTARSGSYFNARIGNCATTPLPGGCN